MNRSAMKHLGPGINQHTLTLLFPFVISILASSPSHTIAWTRPNSVIKIPDGTIGTVEMGVGFEHAAGEHVGPVTDVIESDHGNTRGSLGRWEHAHDIEDIESVADDMPHICDTDEG